MPPVKPIKDDTSLRDIIAAEAFIEMLKHTNRPECLPESGITSFAVKAKEMGDIFVKVLSRDENFVGDAYK